MKEFLSSLPGTVISLGVIATGVIIGCLYLLGLIKGVQDKTEEKKDGAANNLIKILQGTVDELERKVNQQSIDIEKLTKEVHDLKRDNEKYIEIFQGRDKETKEFYKRAYIAMGTVQSTHDMMSTVAESIKNTNTALQGLIEILSKSVDVVGRVAGK